MTHDSAPAGAADATPLATPSRETQLTVQEPACLPQADSDATLLHLWLAGKAPATQRAYTADAAALLRHAGTPLRALTLTHLVAFAETLASLAPATRARKLNAAKSLLSFAHRLGYCAFAVGAPLRVPHLKQTRAERLLSEGDVLRLLALEPRKRNHAILRLLYTGALRVSELCALEWRDLHPRGDAGQVTVFGKGGKTRTILLTAALWAELVSLRDGAGEDAPVFRSNKRGHLTPAQIHRVVKAAAARAGLSPAISAHWLRHAHASHALDRGAPIHLVQHTLGHASVATTSTYLHARPDDSSARYLPE